MSSRDRRHMPQVEAVEAVPEPRRARSQDTGDAPAPMHAAIEHLQREAGNAATASMIDGEPEFETIPGPGEPLDAAFGATMSRRFGTDFSDVRVHSGPMAQASAAALQARAYTVGNHIVQGQSHTDSRTMAHELTHVVQQRNGPVSGTPMGKLNVSSPDDPFERQADTVARAAISDEEEEEKLQPSSLSGPDPAAGDTTSIQRFGFGDIMGMFGGGGGGAGGLLGGLGGMAGGALSGLEGMAGGALGGLGGMAGGALSGVEGMASQGLGQLGGMAGGALSGLEGMAGGALGGLEDEASHGMGGLLGGLGSALGGLFG